MQLFSNNKIWNESLHETNNDNGVNVNFATLYNLIVESTVVLYRNIHKYIWTSPDGKTHNLTYHVLVGEELHPNRDGIRSFRVTVVPLSAGCKS